MTDPTKSLHHWVISSTYLGGRGKENVDGMYVDAGGRILIAGETSSDDFPLTASALQLRVLPKPNRAATVLLRAYHDCVTACATSV